jgi:hypothetical protein
LYNRNIYNFVVDELQLRSTYHLNNVNFGTPDLKMQGLFTDTKMNTCFRLPNVCTKRNFASTLFSRKRWRSDEIV